MNSSVQDFQRFRNKVALYVNIFIVFPSSVSLIQCTIALYEYIEELYKDAYGYRSKKLIMEAIETQSELKGECLRLVGILNNVRNEFAHCLDSEVYTALRNAIVVMGRDTFIACCVNLCQEKSFVDYGRLYDAIVKVKGELVPERYYTTDEFIQKIKNAKVTKYEIDI